VADRHVLLVGAAGPSWGDLERDLRAAGLALEHLGLDAVTARATACAEHRDTIVIVDLGADPARGLSAVIALRNLAPRLPVVVVAQNPSLELVRRVRLAGVFYLALDPLGLDELRAIVGDAFESLARGRPGASRCRARPKILIIDDDVDFGAATRALLEGQGYAVGVARDGRQGLERVKEDPPDLIILDVMMENDWAGYEVNQAIKFGGDYEKVRHTPIIMASSVPIDPVMRFSMASEVGMVTADAYVTKPVDIPRFLELVTSFVGMGGQGDSSGDGG
jgi:two-component system alkaline phosphatase synthesis response regulator PhoP